MRISSVTVQRFATDSSQHTDVYGHVHPDYPHRSSAALITIETETGEKGYSFTQENYQTLRPGATVPHQYKPVNRRGDQLSDAVLGIARDFLIGQDPLSREHIFEQLHKMQRSQNNAVLADHHIMHIDKALWDLLGRVSGLPVYKLLGGHRERVLAYASTMVGDSLPGGLSTPEEYADFAVSCVAQGYKAIKLHTWSHPNVDMDIRTCQAVREAVGDEIELMLDCYHFYDRCDALKLGKAIEKMNFVWYEEPMDEYTVGNYRWLREKLGIPIIGPEVAKGKHYTRAEWIMSGACDIARAGAGSCGGITPLWKIVHLCECHGIPLEMHGTGSANLQVMGAMTIPGKYYERGMLHPFLNYENTPPWLNQPIDPLDSDGYVILPRNPGLGYDINWDYIKEHLLR